MILILLMVLVGLGTFAARASLARARREVAPVAVLREVR